MSGLSPRAQLEAFIAQIGGPKIKCARMARRIWCRLPAPAGSVPSFEVVETQHDLEPAHTPAQLCEFFHAFDAVEGAEERPEFKATIWFDDGQIALSNECYTAGGKPGPSWVLFAPPAF